MSADEFDPFVERLFARAPNMADAKLFEAQVRARLEKTSRMRRMVLGVAGLMGGLIAVRELLTVNLNLNGSMGSTAVGQGLSTAGLDLQLMTQSIVDRAGLSDFALGSMGGMQLFWITAGALAALLAAGAVKLSQEL